ncbi:MAG: exo-alpha-sialidase [Anaerolineae bacterium]|nr:exo-alpha-sialidase [Anaerolineae bacterium]
MNQVTGVREITVEIIWEGRKAGTTWFHPRACAFPHQDSTAFLMTCQSIGGSDVFGQVHWSWSSDRGQTWSNPELIPSLGRLNLADGLQEGVCDVVPEYHAATGTILAIGHNVYYRDNVLTKPSEDRFPVYAVRTPGGKWRGRTKLAWPTANVPAIYTCGCAQRVNLPDGCILIPLSVGDHPDAPRSVCSVVCSFDGTDLTIEEMGNSLSLDVGRGLLEPTLAALDGTTYMTIRAEDGHGYVTSSDDGLLWREMQPWCWDDGEPLAMSTTQQRWIANDHGLFLVYTRRAVDNINVMRWRAPLYIAPVDTDTLRLTRTGERSVIPLSGDGVNDADHVARMGNFHTVNASPDEAWVTVGETLPNDGWKGNTLLARIRWA